MREGGIHQLGEASQDLHAAPTRGARVHALRGAVDRLLEAPAAVAIDVEFVDLQDLGPI
jgi:hypothetical protein